MFALKCEHVRFLQDFIVWPKCPKPPRPKCPQTETAQSETAQTETAQTESARPKRLRPKIRLPWPGRGWEWFVMRCKYFACLYRQSAVA